MISWTLITVFVTKKITGKKRERNSSRFIKIKKHFQETQAKIMNILKQNKLNFLKTRN